MKMNSLIFVVGFIIAFAGGYFIFSNVGVNTAGSSSTPVENQNQSENDAADEAENTNAEEASNEAEAEVTLDGDVEALSRNSCLSCHSVEAGGLAGGTTGPDLSTIYNNIEGKHGKTLDEFLQEPTSAVMSGVIEDNPLEDEEREKIVDLLKEVAER